MAIKPQKGLGRGLEAIFSSEKIEAKIAPMNSTNSVAIDRIEANPKQPRRSFSESALAELAASIKELGVIQPITLRANGGDRYTIISGERRWRASKMAGLTEIPAFIREVDDEQMHAMALVENLQREDLNPIEIAISMQRLMDECGLTQEAMSQRVAMKRSSVSNYLRLLKLSDEVQLALKEGIITMGHAKAIASIHCAEGQVELLKICVERGISVREAEALAQRYILAAEAEQSAESKPQVALPRNCELLASHLEGIFSKGVSIKTNSRGGGKIVINYSNQSELQQLIKELEVDE